MKARKQLELKVVDDLLDTYADIDLVSLSREHD